jgi:hypothetical protein
MTSLRANFLGIIVFALFDHLLVGHSGEAALPEPLFEQPRGPIPD